MAPANREEAITWLNSIDIQELVDDSIMPRESLGPNDNPMTGAEPGASPLLPVKRFTDSLLNTLFVLTHLRSDHAAIKQELLEAVHFRRNTKGQPNRRENCLINLDVNRLVNRANNERNQKRLRGELPPARSDRPGRMERHLQRMGLGSGDQEDRPGIPATGKAMNGEESSLASNHNEMEIEKQGTGGVLEEPPQPEGHLVHDKVLEAETNTAEQEKLGVLSSAQSYDDAESSSAGDVSKLPIIYPLRICKDDDATLAGTHDAPGDVLTLQPRLTKEALFIPIETDDARVADFYYIHLDNFGVLLKQISRNNKNDRRAKKHRQRVTNEREQVLASDLPLARMEHVAQGQYEKIVSWKPRVSYDKPESAPLIYAYLQTMSGLVLSDEMQALLPPAPSELVVQAASPEGHDGSAG